VSYGFITTDANRKSLAGWTGKELSMNIRSACRVKEVALFFFCREIPSRLVFHILPRIMIKKGKKVRGWVCGS